MGSGAADAAVVQQQSSRRPTSDAMQAMTRRGEEEKERGATMRLPRRGLAADGATRAASASLRVAALLPGRGDAMDEGGGGSTVLALGASVRGSLSRCCVVVSVSPAGW